MTTSRMSPGPMVSATFSVTVVRGAGGVGRLEAQVEIVAVVQRRREEEAHLVVAHDGLKYLVGLAERAYQTHALCGVPATRYAT